MTLDGRASSVAGTLEKEAVAAERPVAIRLVTKDSSGTP
jgi:hypothetical protein